MNVPQAVRETNVWNRAGDEVSRRSFLKRSTALAPGASTFTIIKPELVRGAGNEKLKVGLVGCGGRGTEAAQQLLHGNDNVELVAMGDIFEDRLEKSLGEMRNSKIIQTSPSKIKVDPDHHFIGFDAYKKVLASDIDVVMLATPPGYRPEHFVAAVEAKKHIFAEKPFGTDPVGVRQDHGSGQESRGAEAHRDVRRAAAQSEGIPGDLAEGPRRRDRRYRGRLRVLGGHAGVIQQRRSAIPSGAT